MRPTLTVPAAILLTLALAYPLLAAQETADISLGGGLVARLRDRGAFASLEERVANVEQRIVEIVSYKDTQHPQVSVKQKSNLWTVYAWEIPVVSVYPAEAKVNNISEKQLAQMWARNLQQQLPKATPCSKLPPEQLGYGKTPAATVTVSTKPAATGVAAKPAAASAPVAAKPAVTAPAAVTVAAKPAPVSRPAAARGGENGAILLIVDAMRQARELNDEEWAARKENMARETYAGLAGYLGASASPIAPVAVPAKPVSPVAPVATPTPAAPVAQPTPATPPVAAPKPAPVTAPAPPKPATVTAPAAPKPAAAVTAPAAASSGSAYAKVPQKNRIRAKFAAAKPAYDSLVETDPEAAKGISELLSASRQDFSYGRFDEAEQKVDAALAALGVVFKE